MSWQKTELAEERSDVIHAVYERIVIKGRGSSACASYRLRADTAWHSHCQRLYGAPDRCWTRASNLHAALTAQLGLVMTDEPFFPSRTEGLTIIRVAAIRWADELRPIETVRTRVEAEYFGGTPTLYPATARRWTEQRQPSDGLVDLIGPIASFEDDMPPALPGREGADPARGMRGRLLPAPPCPRERRGS